MTATARGEYVSRISRVTVVESGACINCVSAELPLSKSTVLTMFTLLLLSYAVSYVLNQ